MPTRRAPTLRPGAAERLWAAPRPGAGRAARPPHDVESARPARRRTSLGIGVPYRRGGNDSGVRLRLQRLHAPPVFERSLGVVLPRPAEEQAARAGSSASIARAAARRPGVLQHAAAHASRMSASTSATASSSTRRAPAPGARGRHAQQLLGCAATTARAALAERRRAKRPERPASRSGRAAAAQSPLWAKPRCHPARRKAVADPDRRAVPPRACAAPAARRPPPACSPTAWAGRCTTCASRSPTAATSAAATACPRRCSTGTTPSCRRRRC